MKPKNWFESLNCAIEGILHTAKTQRHMKVHFFVAAIVLFLGLFLHISRMELIILALSITLVLFAEMINTAIEETINLIHEEYHPLAKIIKDAAAGGVLIASIGALVMGYWILSQPIFAYVESGIVAVKRAPQFVTIISLVIVLLIVVVMKSHFGRGTPLHGGMPSGHAAVSFALWTSVTLITVDPFISILTLVLAIMVCHSRLLLGIHRTREVFLGGLIGFLTTLLFFQIFTWKEIDLEGENKKKMFSFWNRLYSTLWKRDITQEDIETLIDTVQSTGILDEEENEMIHRIFDLKDMVVREVMVPRTEIKALEVGVPVAEVAKLIVEAGHSRLPVYEGTIDNIVGIIYAKDLLKHWVNKGKDIKTIDLMRKALFVPETKSFGELLQELKSMRIHLAIVVDEYGGTSGLVTIEDLIEEIVGDIQDEYDEEEEEIIELEEGSYLVDARMDIEELAEKLDVEISKNDYDTLGGFLVHLSNKIPSVNEEIRFEKLLFTIAEADERKISKVKIKILSDSETKESAMPAWES